MTLSELRKLIEDEVSAAIAEPLREPQANNRPKKQVYRPVLKNEEEIDIALFHGGRNPDDDK